MGKTKIDWADRTWNPVTGCLHCCEYCYARKITQRFGRETLNAGLYLYPVADKEMTPYPWGFAPTLHAYRLTEPQKIKKPQNIFVCSMADLFGDWVPDEWIKVVFKACEAAPQHRYLFLTKNSKAYKKDPVYSYCQITVKDNWWFGATITGKETRDETWGVLIALTYCRNSFLSIEPLHGPVCSPDAYMPKWIIIGAETGNRKDKIVPKKEWVDSIVEQCQNRGSKVFMKESLRSLMGDAFIQEFPWEVKKNG